MEKVLRVAIEPGDRRANGLDQFSTTRTEDDDGDRERRPSFSRGRGLKELRDVAGRGGGSGDVSDDADGATELQAPSPLVSNLASVGSEKSRSPVRNHGCPPPRRCESQEMNDKEAAGGEQRVS